MDAFGNNDRPEEGQDAGADTGAESRRPQRNALFILAKLTFMQTDKQIEARVRNISSGGMLVESNVFCEPGDNIEAELRNIGMVKGRVSWREGNHFGVAFNNRIDPDQVRFTKPKSNTGNAPTYIRTYEDQVAKHNPGKFRRI